VTLSADQQAGAALQLDLVAEWLEDRARLLTGFDDFGAMELAICAQAIREHLMLPGGIIGGLGQPYPLISRAS
jgi:hypothetical protein